MTKREIELKKHLIKMVHVLKSGFFIDEECRYAYMQGKFNKSSTKDMSIQELKIMLKDMNYKPKDSINNQDDLTGKKATKKQLILMRRLWEEVSRKKDERSLKMFCNRIVGYIPLYLYYLTKEEANKVIIGIKKINENNKDSMEELHE